MIDRNAKLSLSRQARVLGISRGSIYYQPQPVGDADLKLMHRIDQLHMEFPLRPAILALHQPKASAITMLTHRRGFQELRRKPVGRPQFISP